MTQNINEKVIHLRKFFEVYHLDLLNETKLAHIACRRLGISEKTDYALLAWAQKAKLEARTITVSPINLRKLRHICFSILHTFRAVNTCNYHARCHITCISPKSYASIQ